MAASLLRAPAALGSPRHRHKLLQTTTKTAQQRARRQAAATTAGTAETAPQAAQALEEETCPPRPAAVDPLLACFASATTLRPVAVPFASSPPLSNRPTPLALPPVPPFFSRFSRCASSVFAAPLLPSSATPFSTAKNLFSSSSSSSSSSSRTSFSTTASATMSASPQRRLNYDNINPHVKAAKYAVRGELAIRSEEYRARLAKHGDDAGLPFREVISANIGNPQQLDQKPITFFRQVLSLLENPALLDHEDVLRNALGYKQDVLDRARWLLKHVGSVGAYSASNGVPAIRQSIADFLERRDGFPANQADIYLSGGASSGVNTLLHTICAGPTSGVLVPIPQYPLYTASLSVLDAQCVPYYLDEAQNWATDLATIRSALRDARAQGIDVRALVVINPGNPTGASLSEADVEAVIELARAERLVILADEVYQTNVFVGRFHSFKGALRRLQARHRDDGAYDAVELASLHSVSKGMVGECGHRGGYFELVGFDPAVQAEIYKFVSITLCAPVIGQCLVELMVNPPRPGDPSFALYEQEYNAIYEGLRARATALHKAFDQMEGVECGEPQGSMYLFPTVHVPPKAAEAAAAHGRTPDEFYCLKMLEATGVCVVPGSGFGQKPNTLHFRTTFLAPGTEWVGSIVKFHKEFMDTYR
ncbi:alanine aminotransferase [Niveomyces insectorum RCEF 264]|uniref:Glutamate pyruvate transaminase n=1 Tax=Niveomyces insectorum RCEF 264 TaxID=1081102 RepID=A0A167TYE5_9HYPO|nr:alanine aminotransferase [Niveomyces insectorum RCEF 264]